MDGTGELRFAPGLRRAVRARVPLHDRPRPPRPLLGTRGGAPHRGRTSVVDARPGGVFETLMVSDADGSEYPTRAVFDEVRPPELLVWTESHSGMRVRSEFVALGPERTEVRIHQTYVPEAFLAPEAQAGFLSSLDRFDAYLAGLATSAPETPHRSRSPRDPRAPRHVGGRHGRLRGPGHRRRVPGAGRPLGVGRARHVGRAVALRGLAHPRGRGAHDHAGALFRLGLHGGTGSRRRRLHAPLRHCGGARRRAPDHRSPGRPPLRGVARVAASGWRPWTARSPIASSTSSTSWRPFR